MSLESPPQSGFDLPPPIRRQQFRLRLTGRPDCLPPPIVRIRIYFIETILTIFYFPILNGQFQELVGSNKRFKILL